LGQLSFGKSPLKYQAAHICIIFIKKKGELFVFEKKENYVLNVRDRETKMRVCNRQQQQKKEKFICVHIPFYAKMRQKFKKKSFFMLL
jgi:chaperonin cofactor prefoldin